MKTCNFKVLKCSLEKKLVFDLEGVSKVNTFMNFPNFSSSKLHMKSFNYGVTHVYNPFFVLNNENLTNVEDFSYFKQ